MLPTAEHTACTIEMTNLQKRVDLAVIDEIQVNPLRSSYYCFTCLESEGSQQSGQCQSS